ncbi:MAG: hypothetical protein ACTSR8_08180 [Promethearchaeota archaeon]
MKIKDFLVAGFDSIKEPFKNYKSVIKGCIMVLFGILLTRYGLGIGRVTINIVFGIFAYLFLSLSFLLFYKKFFNSNDNHERNVNRTIILFMILNFLGISLIIISIMIYYLNIYNLLIYLVCFSILLFSFLIALKKRENLYLSKVILSLNFSVGLIFGAGLNNIILPLYIYFMVISLSFIQVSREITKTISKNKSITQMKEWRLIKNIKNQSRILSLDSTEVTLLKYPLSFQLIAVIFFILIEFAGIVNTIWYLYLLIIGLMFNGMAMYFNIKSILNSEFHEKINKMLKWTIIFQLLAFLAAS